eukprot:7662047-Prorocentrum_lima.AAC.1
MGFRSWMSGVIRWAKAFRRTEKNMRLFPSALSLAKTRWTRLSPKLRNSAPDSECRSLSRSPPRGVSEEVAAD